MENNSGKEHEVGIRQACVKYSTGSWLKSKMIASLVLALSSTVIAPIWGSGAIDAFLLNFCSTLPR